MQDVGLIDDDQVCLWPPAALQGLDAAHLDWLRGFKAPVVGLHNAMIEAVSVEPLRNLVAQRYAISNKRAPLAVVERGAQDGGS